MNSLRLIGINIGAIGTAMFIIGCMLLNKGLPTLGGICLFLAGFSAGFLTLATVSCNYNPEDE